ncbi:hypothetical protein I3843_01G081000 [Carya illinoinensis]|nr:hypothetical protein I3843_01G081000 [Carya illinoinensis]
MCFSAAMFFSVFCMCTCWSCCMCCKAGLLVVPCVSGCFRVLLLSCMCAGWSVLLFCCHAVRGMLVHCLLHVNLLLAVCTCISACMSECDV